MNKVIRFCLHYEARRLQVMTVTRKFPFSNLKQDIQKKTVNSKYQEPQLT